MGKKYKFTEEQLEEITAAKAKNKNKRIDKRLTVLELSGKGVKRAEIALITGYNIGYIPKLIARYRDGGLEAIVGNHYHGNAGCRGLKRTVYMAKRKDVEGSLSPCGRCYP